MYREWFEKYTGDYGRADLTEENLIVEVVSTVDDLMSARSVLDYLLGAEPWQPPPTPDMSVAELYAAERELTIDGPSNASGASHNGGVSKTMR